MEAEPIFKIIALSITYVVQKIRFVINGCNSCILKAKLIFYVDMEKKIRESAAKFLKSKTIFQVVGYILNLEILFGKIHFPISFIMYHNSMCKIRNRLTVYTVSSCESLSLKKLELRIKSLKASLLTIFVHSIKVFVAVTIWHHHYTCIC